MPTPVKPRTRPAVPPPPRPPARPPAGAATTPRAATGSPPTAHATSAALAVRDAAAAMLEVDTTSRVRPTAARASAAPARAVGTEIVRGLSVASDHLVVGGRAAATVLGPTEASTSRLFAAARLVAAIDQGAFAKLSPSQRRVVIDDVAPFALVDRARPGRPSAHGVKARSAAFAILVKLLPDMRADTEKQRAHKLATALVDGAAQEPHGGLRRTMIAALAALPRRCFLAAAATARAALLDELLPTRPPRDAWLKGKAPVLQVRSSVMDEFWRAELAEYKRRGYDVSEPSGKRAVAMKTFDVDGVPTTVRVDLRKRDTDVLDAMGDKDVHVVLYSGHANLGAIARFALQHGPKARDQKLVGLFACRTKQSLPSVGARFPDAHRIVSRGGTYGHDDRIVTHALLEGIVRGKTYAEIEKVAQKEGLWERDNYAFPDDADQLQHLDFDGDGAVVQAGDRVDVLFDAATAPRSGAAKSISMKPLRAPPDPAGLPGGRVADVVEWFDTIQFYWAEAFGTKAEQAMADRFRADGWFSGPKEEVVRVVEQNGARMVRINAAYSHLSPDALAMLATFELSLHTQAITRPHEALHDRRMRALAMVGSYVYHLVEFCDQADLLLKKFAAAKGFPPGLSWPVVEKSVAADYDHDAGPKTIALMERGMGHAFLEVKPERTSVEFREYIGEALREMRDSKSAIGRATFEIIATGRVKLDELADFTKHDYEHIRTEFAREDIHLPAAGYETLDDGRTKAMRVLSSTINGYAWDDRIYVARGLSVKKLAETLVHEVNHVLNRSEEHYQGKAAILVEEYRAFYAEKQLAGKKMTSAECRALKQWVIDTYTLAPMTPNDVPDVPPGILMPGARA